MKTIAVLSLLILAACTTPERVVSVATWGAAGTTSTQAISREVGWQLWIGERSDTTAGPNSLASSQIGKVTTEGTILGLAGLTAGALTGGAGGALVGGVGGGGIGALIDSNTTPTTSTAAILAPILARLMGGGPALPGLPTGTGGLPTADMEALLAQALLGRLSTGTTSTLPFGLASPALGAWLKGYLAAHPEACQLVPILGQAGVDALIDSVFGKMSPS